MLRIKVLYETIEEKENFIKQITEAFEVVKVSKEYEKDGLHRRIHIDLKNKIKN